MKRIQYQVYKQTVGAKINSEPAVKSMGSYRTPEANQWYRFYFNTNDTLESVIKYNVETRVGKDGEPREVLILKYLYNKSGPKDDTVRWMRHGWRQWFCH